MEEILGIAPMPDIYEHWKGIDVPFSEVPSFRTRIQDAGISSIEAPEYDLEDLPSDQQESIFYRMKQLGFIFEESHEDESSS